MAFLQSLQGPAAYALLFAVLVGSGFGLPVNEDLLLLAAAALTLRGVMEPVPLVAVAWCGIVCADALIFHWGHRFGAPLLRHRIAARALPPPRLEAMQAAMRRWGPACLFAVRFLPGLRTALLFAAGSLKMRYRHLFVFDGAAALIEIPLLVYAVRYVGGRWQDILAALQRWQAVLWPLLAVLLVAGWIAWRARRRGRPSA
ncbi:MAG TPA: DedA family protein [Ramlibacter sp.]|uniref:DedA family protein n=1 Tax=Ramlibacter sp. TaxID=1917967 RepID=UPI002D396A4D|nr:DedA family protein [Ramlibacter sp.]HZY18144.1 DedA family protein [Ramlibacter sp.]